MWDQNLAINQLVNSAETLCWSAKWLGEKEVFFSSLQKHSKKQMLKKIYALLDEADVVVHYNGKKHDIPHLNRGFIELGLPPPSPYKQVDLLETAKRQFKFPSNKLEYVVKALGLGEKFKTSGFELWVGCMRNDPKSWAEMTAYNIQDVIILEKLYINLLPWVTRHANHSLHNKGERVCPRCGSSHVQKRGYTHTLASTFQRYQCKGCGGWFKDNVILNRKDYKTSEIL